MRLCYDGRLGRYMSRSSKYLLAFGMTLIGLAIAFQGASLSRESREQKVSVGLSSKVPTQFTGWNVQDEPLGQTEVAEGAVKEILNYDEYVYRILRSQGREVGVYAAYWAQGRMPTRLIQLHTPDRCWIENGWTCDAMEFHHEVTMREGELKPAQWRIFTPPGANQKTYTLFWLMVSGEGYDFGDRPNLIPNPFRWWGQFLNEIIFGYEEHYFIRLTSNVPFDQLEDDAGFQELLEALAELGLRAEPEAKLLADG